MYFLDGAGCGGSSDGDQPMTPPADGAETTETPAEESSDHSEGGSCQGGE